MLRLICIYCEGTDIVSVIDHKAINQSLSWRHDHLVFNGATLPKAMAEVSSYSSVKFEIAGE